MKTFALFLALLLFVAAPAQAAKRVALLIGNSSYQAGRLTNPPQDVQVMEAALRKLGFTVSEKLNASQKEMKSAVRDFGQEAEGAEVAFFYYSGHGTQAVGENYLIPVDAAIGKESDYGVEAVPANDVLRQIQGARPKAAILVLDACRDNPYAATTRSTAKGLGRMDAPSGTMIAFATAPNTTASDNGDYAKVLARELQKPQELLDVFRSTSAEVKKLSGGKQEPRISEVSISEKIYLASVEPVPVATSRPAAPEVDPEQEAWAIARKNDTARAYQAYLNAYPNGKFASAARVALILQEGAEPDKPTPAVSSISSGNEDAAQQYAIGRKFYIEKDYTQAMTWLRKAADQGYVKAQNNVAYLYAQGLGVQQDYSQAMAWYRKSADQGYANGQHAVAAFYAGGIGVQQDYSQAMIWFRKAADQGHADAQCRVGYLYQDGLGVPQDYAQAMIWFRKAADQGNAVGQAYLGSMYAKGQGVAQSDVDAVRWFRKAAEQGDTYAQSMLQFMYVQGREPQEDAQTVAWYRKCAEQGLAFAQYRLGMMYREGRGVAKDDTQAVAWLRKAAEQGYADAQSYLGWMYEQGFGTAQDYAQAVAWYRKAAEQGYRAAQSNMGSMYYNGRGVAQDYAQALAWFRKAADSGYAGAQYFLGFMYEKGRGVAQSDTEAVKWYRKAAEQGNADAKEALRRLQER